MDYRPYILAGSFLLLVVAAVTFVVALSRARRHPHVHGHPAQAEPMVVPSKPLDTNLEGLEVIVEADAPSASLLTPLRESEWVPPEEPAPLKDLPDVSLASRIARFDPGPSVPEPAFTIPQYPAWEVPVPDATGTALSEVLPHVRPEDAHDEFGAEIAALLPALDDVSAPVSEPILPALTPTFVPAPAPETEPQAPAPETEPQAPAPETEPQAPAPETEPQAPAPAAPQPVPQTQAAPVVPPVASEPEPETWVAAAIEGSTPVPRAEAVARERTPDRPAVSVRSEPVPQAAPNAKQAVATPTVARPSVRVHDSSSLPARDGLDRDGAAPVAKVAQPIGSREAAGEADIHLAAPVEMWFGDHRVGVKQGSATFDRFRKYADTLLDDLKDATRSSR